MQHTKYTHQAIRAQPITQNGWYERKILAYQKHIDQWSVCVLADMQEEIAVQSIAVIDVL